METIEIAREVVFVESDTTDNSIAQELILDRLSLALDVIEGAYAVNPDEVVFVDNLAEFLDKHPKGDDLNFIWRGGDLLWGSFVIANRFA